MPRTKKKKGPKTRKDYRQSRSNIWVQFLEDDCQTREQSYFGGKVTQYNSSDSPKFIMDESDKLNFQGSGYRFLYKREIETNEFIKLYELGINAILKLNNAGKTVFALAMHQLLKAPKKATAIVLDYDYLTKEQKKLVSYGIFSRGINNLLAKSDLSAQLELVKCDRFLNIYTTNYDNLIETANELTEHSVFEKEPIVTSERLSNQVSKKKYYQNTWKS